MWGVCLMSGDLEIRKTSSVVSTAREASEVVSLIQSKLSYIREDMRDNTYIIEAIRVLPVGGHRSAIGAFWNAVVDDLRNKIIFRSVTLFNKEVAIGRTIKSYEDFQDYVNDDQLIEGAYKIGVIGWEASKVLKHAKETRHIFSGHPKSSDPSIIKVLGMMEDCVNYVLNVEYPMQIIDIDDYITQLGTEDYDRNKVAIENALGDLPENYKNELVNRLFTAYIHPDCSTILRSNIEFCTPILWKVLPKTVKVQIVRRVDQEIPKGNTTSVSYAFAFVEIVDGAMYLSTLARKYKVEPIINRLNDSLDSWSTENSCVEELEPLAGYIPSDLLPIYVNALTQTYIGTTGSSYQHARTDFYADGASYRIPGMFEKFDDEAAEAFIEAIKLNDTIKHRIRTSAKMRRLRSLGHIVLERVSDRFKDRELLELLVDDSKEREFFASIRN